MLEKIFIFLVNMFYLFFATSGMGYIINDRFVLSLPLVCLILMDIVLIIMLISKRTKVRVKPFIFGSFFVVWAIIITVTRYSIASFIASILGLILMWIPLIIRIPTSENFTFLKLSKLYCRGLIFSFLGAYQDIVSGLFSLPKTQEIIPFAVVQSVGNLSYSLNLNIDRINSFMTEPSEYASYLVFGYICLDYLEDKKSIGSKTLIILRIHILLFLLFTFSITGFLLFISYLIINFVSYSAITNYVKLLKKIIINCLLIVILFFVAIYMVPNLGIAMINPVERIQRFESSSKNLNSSEGSRFNSINMAFDSLGSDYGFIGHGYGKNTSNWISENYGNQSIQYAEGNVFNLYAAVTISVGLPGLLFFIGLIYQAFINSQSEDNSKQKMIFFLVWLISGFCFG
ncbi:MAG: O-antigen ligase family protein, partial [Dolichospermum sp.]